MVFRRVRDSACTGAEVVRWSQARLPCEVRRLRDDLVVARAKVVALEDQINSLHNLREVAEVAFKEENDVHFGQLERERKMVEWVCNQKLKESRSQLAEAEMELNSAKKQIHSLTNHMKDKDAQINKFLEENKSAGTELPHPAGR